MGARKVKRRNDLHRSRLAVATFVLVTAGGVFGAVSVVSPGVADADDGVPDVAQGEPEVRESDPTAGDVVGVPELLADPTRFDNQVVTVEGEFVGDYGFRDDGYMWTQLNDDAYARAAIVDGGPRDGSNIAIGVRMPTELGTGLDPPGGYRLEGPLVRATGVWRYHDPDRGGETFLDIESLSVVGGGRRLQEGPDWVVMATGAVLVAIAGVMWLRRRDIDG